MLNPYRAGVPLHVLRRRMDYPELKRQVREQAAQYKAKTILLEDKASGTQLIQELIQEGLYGVTRYSPKMDKVMRMHSVTSTMENGMVYLPEKAPWLSLYFHELLTFPRGKYDDQADSTSQALDWVKEWVEESGYFVWLRLEARRVWVENGEWDNVRDLDEKYGPPLELALAPGSPHEEPVVASPVRVPCSGSEFRLTQSGPPPTFARRQDVPS